MKEGVNVYGGFVGTESTLEERPPLIYGYTADENASILDAAANASSSDARRILNQEGAFNTETVWDGFVMKNGSVSKDGAGAILRKNGILSNCTLTNNQADGSGGGIVCEALSKVINCRIINNKAGGDGGGMLVGNENSGATNRPIVINCLITNNTAVNGGGMRCKFAEITNCTITNNHASGENGGGVWAWDGAPVVTNCIIWNNTATDANTKEAKQISGGGSANTHSSSSYYATLGSTGAAGISKMILAGANTGTDGGIYPAFVNPATKIGYTADQTEITQIFAADWRLTANSACKDAGTPDPSALNLPATDLAGSPRIIYRIDMGAFEYYELVKQSQTITWEQTFDYVFYGDEPLQLTATASSELPVTYSSDNGEVAVIVDGNKLSIVGIGTATITARQNGNGDYKPAAPVDKTITILSSDADLKSLEVSEGDLDPEFSAEVIEYAVEAPYAVTSITLTAEAHHAGADVSGDVGEQTLDVGENSFEITVTAEAGNTKTYTVVVTRQLETAIKETTTASAKVYTDLVTNKLFIETDDNTTPLVHLYNPTGILLLRTQSNEIDLSSLASGVYIVKINDRTIKTFKK
jgi:hypothetical protein